MKAPGSTRALKPRHARFVAEYVIDLNATQAAKRAGYSRRTANEQGARLLANVSISAAIARLQAKQLAKTELTAELVKQAIRRSVYAQAHGDMRRFFTPSGRLRRIVDLTEDEAAQLAGFDVIIKNAAAGDGHTDTVHKIKLRGDAAHFTELAARHLGMLTDKLEVNVSEVEMAELDAGRQANAEARRLREAAKAAK